LLAAKAIRPDKLLFETGQISMLLQLWRVLKNNSILDAPWCSMTSTHASNILLETLPASLKSKYFPSGTKLPSFMMGKPVKGRNEPSAIGGVAWVIHRLNEGVPFEKVTEKAYKNTVQLFGLEELRVA
jgi:TatD DNase family protein